MQTNSSVPRYFLQPETFLREVAEGGVVLDVRKNQYIGLSPEQMRLLSVCVHGWPRQAGVGTIDEEAMGEVARDFVQRGILTEDPSVGKDASPARVAQPEEYLVDSEIAERPANVLSYLPALAASCASAMFLLRARSLAYAVDKVRRRKQQRTRLAAHFDRDRACLLTQAFYWLGPLLFTARDRCLYESLVLLEFLARYDLYPTWVIGVKAFAPFSAHSWVQHEAYTLTGSPERVRAFAPILAV